MVLQKEWTESCWKEQDTWGWIQAQGVLGRNIEHVLTYHQ